jgi:hypothetical protein
MRMSLLHADNSCVTPSQYPCTSTHPPSLPAPWVPSWVQITFLHRVPTVDHLRMHLPPYDHVTSQAGDLLYPFSLQVTSCPSAGEKGSEAMVFP